jgi:hypothetical protein
MSNVNSQRTPSATQKPTAAEFTQKVQKSKGNAKPSACVVCKRKVTIFPLRYGIVASDKIAERNKLTPDFPAHLKPNLAKKKLDGARYAIRKLRSGFLYVFTQRIIRNGKKPIIEKFNCEAAFKVSESGTLEYYKNMSGNIRLSSHADMLVVHDVPNIKEFRLLFTPDPLTYRMIQRIAKEEKLKKQMQFFDLNANIKNPTEKNVLAPELIHKHLAESIATRLGEQPVCAARGHTSDFKLVKVLEEQLFTAPLLNNRLTLVEWERQYTHNGNDHAYHFNHDRLIFAQFNVERLKHEDEETGRGFAVVLNDHLGMTQALNAWRNAGIQDSLEEWEKKPAEHGDGKANNKRALHVALAFDELRPAYADGMALFHTNRDLEIQAAQLFDPSVRAGVSSVLTRKQMEEREKALKAEMEKRKREAFAKLEKDAADGVLIWNFDKKFTNLSEEESKKSVGVTVKPKGKPATAGKTDNKPQNKIQLEMDTMAKQKEAFATVSQTAYKIMLSRVEDHKVWFESDHLVSAIDFYDDENKSNGWRMAGQTGLCITGAEGAPLIAEILEKQWKGDPLDPKNIALRSFACNQKSTLQALAETVQHARNEVEKSNRVEFKRSREEIWKDLQGFLNWGEKLIKEFEALAKAFGADEENLPFQSFVVASNAWLASLATRILSYNPSKKLDFWFPLYRNWLVASVDRQMVNFVAKDTRQSFDIVYKRLIDKTRFSRTGKTRSQWDLDKQWKNAGRSDFHRIRANSAMLIFEASMLILYGSQLPTEHLGKAMLQLTGQILTLGVAGIEMVNTGMNLLVKMRNKGNEYDSARRSALDAVLTRNRHIIQGLKLTGSTLSHIGVIAFAWTDVGTGNMVAKEGDKILATAYRARAVITIAWSIGSIGLAMGAARPMFVWLVDKSSALVIRGLLSASTALSAEAVVIGLTRFNAVASLLITAITIGMIIFGDGDMESWCKHSTYRNKGRFGERSPHKSLDAELDALFSTLEELR